VECCFSLRAQWSIGEKKLEGASVVVGDMLDELQIEKNEIVGVPEGSPAPPSQRAAVECERRHCRCRQPGYCFSFGGVVGFALGWSVGETEMMRVFDLNCL